MTEDVTAFGPDFPFAYDDWLKHPAGLAAFPVPREARKWRSSGPGWRGSWPPTS